MAPRTCVVDRPDNPWSALSDLGSAASFRAFWFVMTGGWRWPRRPLPGLELLVEDPDVSVEPGDTIPDRAVGTVWDRFGDGSPFRLEPGPSEDGT